MPNARRFRLTLTDERGESVLGVWVLIDRWDGADPRADFPFTPLGLSVLADELARAAGLPEPGLGQRCGLAR